MYNRSPLLHPDRDHHQRSVALLVALARVAPLLVAARLVVVMMVMVALLLGRLGAVGHDQLGAVAVLLGVPVRLLRILATGGSSGRPRLAGRRLVQVLPRLPVVAVQAVARLRARGVEGGDGVAVGRGAVPVMLGAAVPAKNGRLSRVGFPSSSRSTCMYIVGDSCSRGAP